MEQTYFFSGRDRRASISELKGRNEENETDLIFYSPDEAEEPIFRGSKGGTRRMKQT